MFISEKASTHRENKWRLVTCFLNQTSEQIIKQKLKLFQKLVCMMILSSPHLHRWGRTSGWAPQASLAPSYPGDLLQESAASAMRCRCVKAASEQQGQEAEGSLSGLFKNCETTHHHTAIHTSHKFLYRDERLWKPLCSSAESSSTARFSTPWNLWIYYCFHFLSWNITKKWIIKRVFSSLTHSPISDKGKGRNKWF